MKPLDSPTKSTRSCADLLDGLKTYIGAQRACIHAHSDADSLNIPENMSENSNLCQRCRTAHEPPSEA